MVALSVPQVGHDALANLCPSLGGGSCGKHNNLFYQKMWQDINIQSNWSGEIINKDSSGNEIIQWISISAIADENEDINNYLAIFSDLTALKNTKFECFARIRIGTEIITPYQFLESVKLSGLLPEITKVMIDKSFKAMQINDYTFSINITEDDLSQKYLLKYIKDIDTNKKSYEITRAIAFFAHNAKIIS